MKKKGPKSPNLRRKNMNYKRITVQTLSKIAIVLLAIIAITTLVSTFKNSTFEKVSVLGDMISEAKQELAFQDESIADNESKIVEYSKSI
jgi:hypothetical protein